MHNETQVKASEGARANLSEADLRLIFQLASMNERWCAPVYTRPDEALRARELARKGLLAMHEGLDSKQVRCLSYAVTAAGVELFNRLTGRQWSRSLWYAA